MQSVTIIIFKNADRPGCGKCASQIVCSGLDMWDAAPPKLLAAAYSHASTVPLRPTCMRAPSPRPVFLPETDRFAATTVPAARSPVPSFPFPPRPTTSSLPLTHTPSPTTHSGTRRWGLHEAEGVVRCGERERGGARRFVPVTETLFAGGPARSGGNGPENDRSATVNATTRARYRA